MSLPSRRDFLKSLTAAGSTALAAATGGRAASEPIAATRDRGRVAGLVAPKLETVRWGIIGIGQRGYGTLQTFLGFEGCELRAVCDTSEPALRRALAAVEKAGLPAPATFGGGPEAYRKLIERPDIDVVLICTPWRVHVPMAVAAMRAGKHAFVEVPAAVTLDECWELVDTAEATRRHCMMLENCCYGREELMVLRMCREGAFGELEHGEGSYLHDLRAQLRDGTKGEGLWRIPEHIDRDGNLYPTHGLGPVAQYMGINRGDCFASLVSMSGPALGLGDYAQKNLAAGDPRRTTRFRCGDMNTSLIKTERGRTLVVQHNTSNAMPYSRGNLIQGTRGIFAGYPNRIYIEGRSARPHQWDTDLAPWYAEFEHPLWQKAAAAARRRPLGQTGHGGMDFVLRWRIVQCLREGLPLDQDVYDAAAWSAIAPLSEKSVSLGGAPVAMPDFTRGAWRTTPPLGIVS